MDFNRNHYFMAGLVLLVLGIQMRFVESLVLNSDTTRFLAARLDSGTPATGMAKILPPSSNVARKALHPPEWLGWALMSVGSVLILHSLAMPKPSG
jgi:hypothetical protein